MLKMSSNSITNRYYKYKDSGIEWIRKIPESWSVKRLKVLASIQTGNTPPKEIMSEILELEKSLDGSLEGIFNQKDNNRID